jgi:hypothetical protein
MRQAPCAELERDRPEYYVRRDATSYHAKPDELTMIVASGDTHASVVSRRGGGPVVGR